MSFGDPFGPFRPGIGPDIVQEPSVRRPDVFIEPYLKPRPSARLGIRNLLKIFGMFGAATGVLTVLFAVPVFVSEFAAIETVGVHGKVLSAPQFADRLENLLIGSFIVALSLVSFFASAAIASPRLGVRDHEREPYKFECVDGHETVQSTHAKVRHV
ncbi:hypothetical protein [Roseibium sp.]|uniref:hypothetical protein n=1 Tax=Roseibium sp. TaxID=1936156 RepID=UPI003D0BD6E0